MRIEDEDILRIIKRDGPSVAGYIAQQLKIKDYNDRKKLNRKLTILAKYGFVQREAQNGVYVYSFPNDKRPVNKLAKNCETARDVFNEHIKKMEPGDTITRQQVQDMLGCNDRWACRLLHASELIPIRPRDYRKPTKWQKGASL